MVGLSKGLCAALSRCPEIRKPLRYYQYRCYFLLALTALAGGITGAALALMVASMLSILPYSIVLLLTDNFPALVSFTLILGLILTGISYLLVVDLARDFYRMIDRYNAYVAEQAKAKAESPRPA